MSVRRRSPTWAASAGSMPPSPSRAWWKIVGIGLVDADLVGEGPVVELPEHPVAVEDARAARSTGVRPTSQMMPTLQPAGLQRPDGVGDVGRELGLHPAVGADVGLDQALAHLGLGVVARARSSTASAAWCPVNCSVRPPRSRRSASRPRRRRPRWRRARPGAPWAASSLGDRDAARRRNGRGVGPDERVPEVEGDGVDAPAGRVGAHRGRQTPSRTAASADGRGHQRRRPGVSNTDGIDEVGRQLVASDTRRGDGVGRGQLHVLGDRRWRRRRARPGRCPGSTSTLLIWFG